MNTDSNSGSNNNYRQDSLPELFKKIMDKTFSYTQELAILTFEALGRIFTDFDVSAELVRLVTENQRHVNIVLHLFPWFIIMASLFSAICVCACVVIAFVPAIKWILVLTILPFVIVASAVSAFVAAFVMYKCLTRSMRNTNMAEHGLNAIQRIQEGDKL